MHSVREVIVVEGRYDKNTLSQVVDAVIEHDPYGPVAAEAYLVKGEGNLYINEIATARTAP